MKNILKFIAAFLLIFNGIGAMYGGWNLIIHPDGSSIQLPMEWLKHAPFNDYFIPGIILFIANGLLSFVVLAAMLLNHRFFSWFIMAQGAILTGWIIIQIILVQKTYYLQGILGGVGIALIILGIYFEKRNDSKIML